MNTENWSALTSRGTVLTTELNSIASLAYSGLGTAIDNGTNLDVYGVARLSLTAFGVSPTLDGTIELYALCALDGANYEDGSSSLRYPQDALVGVFQVYNNTSAQLLDCKPFVMNPAKTKFGIFNNTSQALAASGNTVTLYTFNRVLN